MREDEKPREAVHATPENAAARAAWRADEAGQGARFPEDDPRAPPYLPEERARARDEALSPRRWHLTVGADWLAVRLQIGRGRSFRATAKMFGISDSSIRRHAEDERWVWPMSERDLRVLARRVWLGGLARCGFDDTRYRAALRIASEWRPIVREAAPPLFEDVDRFAARAPAIHEIGNDEDGHQTDARREKREEIGRNLDALIARLEAEAGEALEGGPEGAAAVEHGGGEQHDAGESEDVGGDGE